MALIDGLLRDSLLENIARSEVYIALRSDLKSDSTRFGAGTADDPYDGSRVDLGGGNYFYKLDKILRDFVLPNATIYLSPGEFQTKGYRNSASDGWTPKSGWRIVGGGWAGDSGSGTKGPTTLKLEEHPGGELSIVGMNIAGTALTSFEIVHVGFNCNLPPGPFAWMSSSAIDIVGDHIRIRDCQFFNFGVFDSRAPYQMTVVSIARGSHTVIDCVMSGCVFRQPSVNCSNAIITCVGLSAATGGTHFNRACVVRGVFVDGSNAQGSTVYGLSATGCAGTILEENRIWNCATGVFVFEGAASALPITRDLIIRDNVFFNVTNGVYLKLTSDPSAPPPYPIGRLVILQNNIDLSTSASPTAPTAIKIASSASPKNQSIIEQLIVRQNIIRHTNGESGPLGSVGITLECIDDAIVDENIINIGDHPDTPSITNAIVRTSTVKMIKTFNNQSTAGMFIPCWNSSASARDTDPITDMEDSLIGLL